MGDAPGRKIMQRPNGRRDVYWVARADAVKAGYVPKSVKLDDPGEPNAPPEIAARCRVMWAEMLEFVAGQTAPGRSAAVGTIAWLLDLYQTDSESPYHAIRASTRDSYDKGIRIVRKTIGERRCEMITANDVRRWFKVWGRAEGGALANPRRAYGCVQMLRIAAKYGKGQRLPGCRDLSEILSEAEFPTPKSHRPAMSEAQAAAIVAKAREAGSPSIGLAVALQFACGLRQKDVIGEYVDGAWSMGLRWGEHIGADWQLTKPTSKSNGNQIAEFDLTLLPMVMAELSRITATSRIGPVILDERTGRPYHQRAFARRFREIAQAAEVPDTVYNMDARAGAVTHAYGKGATPSDAMDLATHTQLATSRHYSRDRKAATSRVAILRFGPKNGPETKGQ